MAQLIGRKISVKGKIKNSTGGLSFDLDGKRARILPFVAKRIPDLNFEEVEAEISFVSSFSTKVDEGAHQVNERKMRDSDIKEVRLTLPGYDLVLENMNIFVPQDEEFKAMIVDALNSEIAKGSFDDVLDNEKTPYTYQEDVIALEIYLKTKGKPYQDILDHIKERIEIGEIKRSADSLEMRVNTFKHLDLDSGVEGLKPKSQTVQVWDDYINAKLKKDETGSLRR